MISNLPAKTDLRILAAIIKARWICVSRRHQQLKEELGLDHFEGRSWRGLHRHALMTMTLTPSSSIVARKQGGKKNPRATTSAQLAAVRQAIVSLIMRPLQRCPNCQTGPRGSA